jgi:hypothetical protein
VSFFGRDVRSPHPGQLEVTTEDHDERVETGRS